MLKEAIIGNDGLTLAHSLDAADADFTQEHLFLAIAEKVPANVMKDGDGNVVSGNLIAISSLKLFGTRSLVANIITGISIGFS